MVSLHICEEYDDGAEGYLKMRELNLLPSSSRLDWLEYPWGLEGFLPLCAKKDPPVDSNSTQSRLYFETLGHWILRVRWDALDLTWAKACSLFTQGQIGGVYNLKAATHRISMKHLRDQHFHILFLVQEPVHRRGAIMEIGRRIKKIFAPRDKIFYRTNGQCELGAVTVGYVPRAIYSL